MNLKMVLIKRTKENLFYCGDRYDNFYDTMMNTISLEIEENYKIGDTNIDTQENLTKIKDLPSERSLHGCWM